MQSQPPRTAAKQAKRDQDLANFRSQAIESIAAITDDDIVGMFGMLGNELVNRRREAELDIIRLERFHSEDVDNIARIQKNLDGYTRRFRACSGMLKLANTFAEPSSLRTVLEQWADDVTTAKD